MLDVINLHFDYHDKPLLNNVSFHLPSSGLLHLKGPNGSGKTTLLKLLAGLCQPIGGEIQFNKTSIELCLPVYQQQLCYVGHKSGLNPYLTIRENCLFDSHYQRGQYHNIEEVVSVFGLQAYLDYPCGLLSAGQRRQVSLLRLWMTNAQLWLLDEPLVALDDSALGLLMDKLSLHRKNGGAILLTSHQTLPLQQDNYQEYHL